jgi:hypothetical protein
VDGVALLLKPDGSPLRDVALLAAESAGADADGPANGADALDAFALGSGGGVESQPTLLIVSDLAVPDESGLPVAYCMDLAGHQRGKSNVMLRPVRRLTLVNDLFEDDPLLAVQVHACWFKHGRLRWFPCLHLNSWPPPVVVSPV